MSLDQYLELENQTGQLHTAPKINTSYVSSCVSWTDQWQKSFPRIQNLASSRAYVCSRQHPGDNRLWLTGWTSIINLSKATLK